MEDWIHIPYLIEPSSSRADYAACCDSTIKAMPKIPEIGVLDVMIAQLGPESGMRCQLVVYEKPVLWPFHNLADRRRGRADTRVDEQNVLDFASSVEGTTNSARTWVRRYRAEEALQEPLPPQACFTSAVAVAVTPSGGCPPHRLLYMFSELHHH